MEMDLRGLLGLAFERQASDVHLRAEGPAYLRIDGDLVQASPDEYTQEQIAEMARSMMTPEQQQEFATANEVDFAFDLEGVGRFRCNVYRQRGMVAAALRRVQPGSASFEALGLPPAVRGLAEERRGLVLVTGMTGSGKTTTVAAMLDHINMTRRCHIVTLEDPIEVMHPDKMAIVDQREIGIDTATFGSAMRAAMRQDPDVIFVGEMRDAETVSAAMHAAETGHFVLSTLHTIDASETVNRIIEFFPPHQQQQARITLAGALRGIVSQRLVQKAGGTGRLPAIEVLVMNGRIFDMIVNPEQTSEIESVIAEGEYYGMQTFDQHLMKMLKAREITMDEAMAAATSPHDLMVLLRQAGLA
jgi:twitching motility protein PilT